MRSTKKLREKEVWKKEQKQKEFRQGIREALGLNNLKIKPREGHLMIDLSDF